MLPHLVRSRSERASGAGRAGWYSSPPDLVHKLRRTAVREVDGEQRGTVAEQCRSFGGAHPDQVPAGPLQQVLDAPKLVRPDVTSRADVRLAHVDRRLLIRRRIDAGVE